MKQMTLVTLNDCGKCKTIRHALDKANISYDIIDCDSDPAYCDQLENMTKSEQYPMIIVNKANTLELYYVVDRFNDLHLDNTIIDNYTLKPQALLINLINKIII
jgi:glutaredoxin